MRFLTISLFVVLIGFGIYLYNHLGFTKEPDIIGLQTENFFLLGTSHTGPYFKIHEKILELESWAKKQNLPCETTFGYYLDDPKISDEDRLRSEGGCVSKSFNYDNTPLLPKHIFTKSLESKEYLVLEFSGSPAISPFKVYPLAEEWFVKNKLDREIPVLEVYEVHTTTMKTRYYFPVKKAPVPNTETPNPEGSSTEDSSPQNSNTEGSTSRI
jgi:DNA gyrase inhibitor GyrI